MNKKGPIFLCAGGTGGHVAPAIAVYEELVKRGTPCYLLTDGRCESFVRASVLEKDYGLLPARPLRRTIGGGILFSLAFVKTLKTCFDHYWRLKPRAILLFGGYASLGAGLMAFLFKIPIYVHEQNAYLGRTNRLLSVMARRLFTTFPQTAGIPKSIQPKTTVTGIPVRAAIGALEKRPYLTPGPGEAFHFTVLGGSQGAHFFADLVPMAVNKLDLKQKKRLRLYHQVPAPDLDRVRALYAHGGIAAQCAPFFSHMADLLNISHGVMARAGASTLGELICARLPAILIPYPLALDNHQLFNARALEQGGGVWVFEQKDMTPSCLQDLLYRMMTDRETMTEKSAKMALFSESNATDTVIAALDRE